jgi:hypothetical protein
LINEIIMQVQNDAVRVAFERLFPERLQYCAETWSGH